MSTTTFALQKAIYSAVDAALSVPVYDFVPQGSTYPYVTIDFQEAFDNDFLNGRKDRHLIYLTIWSDYRGQKEVMDIMSDIDATLHEARPALETGRVVQMRVIARQTSRDEDGLTYMGRVRLQVITEH